MRQAKNSVQQPKVTYATLMREVHGEGICDCPYLYEKDSNEILDCEETWHLTFEVRHNKGDSFDCTYLNRLQSLASLSQAYIKELRAELFLDEANINVLVACDEVAVLKLCKLIWEGQWERLDFDGVNPPVARVLN